MLFRSEIIKAYKDDLKGKTILHPTTAIIRFLLDKMNDDEINQFEAILMGELQPNNSLSDKVKYALTTYYEYSFRKNNIANPNYIKVMQLNYNKPELAIKISDPLDRQGVSRVTASYIKNGHSESLLMSYRPFLSDLFDIQQKNQQISELSIFNSTFKINNQSTTLFQLDLVNIKSLPARSRFFKPVSWQFYTGFNRGNPTENLDYETEFGLGITNNMSFLTVNYGINAGVDFTTGDYYYKPNAIILARLSDHLKIGFNAHEKHYKDKTYVERNTFASLSFNSYALNTRYISKSSNNKKTVMLSLHYYFD